MIVSPNLLRGAGALLAAASHALGHDEPGSTGAYALTDSFKPSNFFDDFVFFSASDPTHGFVKYSDASTANDNQLAGFVSRKIFLGVDHISKHNSSDPTDGRPSTRVESKKSWDKGLFIFDIRHMPAGTESSKGCGLWPAIWTVGPGWPKGGEIDIIEAVNTYKHNFVVLHTEQSCNITNTGSKSDTKLETNDCIGKVGCRQNIQSTKTFGADFNAAGGGVYVMEWTNDDISVWFFTRNDPLIHTTLSKTPDPKTFGGPIARFVGDGCDLSKNFYNHRIILNIALCGEWAGKQEEWDNTPECKAMAPTCSDFVATNPEAFRDAYWIINSIRVFQKQA